MPLLLDHLRLRSNIGRVASCAAPLDIGLVNNMPDAAIEATERQFVQLLDAASGDTVIRLKLFCLPEVDRSDLVRHRLQDRYSDIAALWDAKLDGLIVTGTEPRAADLRAEPYWPALTKLIDWAQENTASTIWSCLAAHAAVLHLDGVERRPLPDKRFGVFDCIKSSRHSLTSDAALPLRIPHSRWNDLRTADLAGCGYDVLTRSDSAGVDMFVKQARSLFVFFQGHPEYDSSTLLREYRRDIGRFLRHERNNYPSMPQGYFHRYAVALLDAFQERALAERREDLLASFPMRSLDAALSNSWRASALSIYANWLAGLAECKATKSKSAGGMRNATRQRYAASAVAAANTRSST
ncbi:MAG: homoserine O-succinyltransferase MetA [Steroidobacteraceae bacterium]